MGRPVRHSVGVRDGGGSQLCVRVFCGRNDARRKLPIVKRTFRVKVEPPSMQRPSSNVRIWQALILIAALCLGSRAVEVRSTCQMACAHGSQTCHSCCGDSPSCHLSVSQVLPISSGTASACTQPALLAPTATFSIAFLSVISNSGPASELTSDLWPPPRALLARDCILLL
jgi:hypothetical protein